jgi:glutamate formiminotransferase
MQKILECVPNFSEGKDKKKIAKVLSSIKKIKGVKVLDSSSDPDHNRSVITFLGEPKKVLKAAFEATKTASQIINLAKHKGIHPRIGATDVMPLIPLKNISEKEAIKYSKELGKKIAEELKIPVYFYEKSATTAKRKNLADVRNIGYEQLKKEISKNKNRFPDLGPKYLGKAGAIALGVRNILVAFNINLKTSDIEIAKKIANQIREKTGGLPYVKALGLKLKHKNLAQVSMNLTNYKKTPPLKVFKLVDKLAKKYHTEILESELIGLIPRAALKNTSAKELKITHFSSEKILPL